MEKFLTIYIYIIGVGARNLCINKAHAALDLFLFLSRTFPFVFGFIVVNAGIAVVYGCSYC